LKQITHKGISIMLKSQR